MEIGYKETLINESQNRIGFSFSEGYLNLIDEKKFDSVSKIPRKRLGIPNTTNHIESSHGHLNSMNSRRKHIITILNRLIGFCLRKTCFVCSCINHNLKRKINELMLKTKKFEYQSIVEECAIFCLNENYCLCGQSFSNELSYGVIIPCQHMITKGVNVYKGRIEISVLSQILLHR